MKDTATAISLSDRYFKDFPTVYWAGIKCWKPAEEETMETQDLKFRREPAVDGIHDDIQFNEYVPDGTMWVTIGQIVGGTLMSFGLIVAYAFVAWLEG